MAWSGGTFTRTDGVYSGSGVWVSNRDAGTKILAARHDVQDQDLATGINTCLTKDGQNTPTANLPMGNFIHTGVGNATGRTHYAAMSQVQDGTAHWVGTTGGAANVQTGTLTPTITAYTTGLRVRGEWGFTNTGTLTVNYNSVGAANVRKGNGSIPLTEGDATAGDQFEMVYDGAQFILFNTGPGTLIRDMNTTTTVSNTTTETTLYTATLVGGSLGTHRVFRLVGFGDVLNTTGGNVNYTIRAKLGATTLLTSEVTSIATATNRAFLRFDWEIWNRAAQNSQHTSGVLMFSGVAAEATAGTMRGVTSFGANGIQCGSNASSEDTSADKTITITGQMGTASASAQLRWYKTLAEIL